MLIKRFARLTTAAAAVALLMPTLGSAQSWDYINPIPAGTALQVRTTEPIDTQSMDGRIFTGTIENDVR